MPQASNWATLPERDQADQTFQYKAMKARRIKDLPPSDAKFFRAVSEGLSHILANATRLESSARALKDAGHSQGTEVLRSIAEEEAAKFLILIDAVRCPRQPANVWSRQLGYFNRHLARGIYAEVCGLRPADFRKLERYVEAERETLYLDGPNDVDWIFRTRILANREEAMYVDYVEDDEGHRWDFPRDDEMQLLLYFTPPVLRIAQALSGTGLATPEGLAVVAEVWRCVKVPSLNWEDLRDLNCRTLEKLDEKGLLEREREEEVSRVIEDWPFPLYPLDLAPKEVNREELEQARARWSPDF